MTTKLNYIIGGHGILVSYLSGRYLIELDESILSAPSSDNQPVTTDATTGVFNAVTCNKLTYTTSHGNEANSQTWSSDVANTGMQMTVQTATVYDVSGTHALYAMVRDLSFNSIGQLVSVSAERRITVDNTESCS
jgi:Tfp pilus assembly protein FimT